MDDLELQRMVDEANLEDELRYDGLTPAIYELLDERDNLRHQLKICRDALKELSRHYPNYNPGVANNVVAETLAQLPED